MSERKKMHLTMEKEKSLEKREKLRCDMQPVIYRFKMSSLNINFGDIR